MRSGELVVMRTCDIDRGDPKCWQYTPAIHKTEHHDHVRVVYIDEAAQRLLIPFLTLDSGKYLFNTAEAEAERKTVLTASRRTPVSCGNRVGTNRKADPQKKPGE
jgi:hypothetical protein